MGERGDLRVKGPSPRSAVVWVTVNALSCKRLRSESQGHGVGTHGVILF